MKFVIDSNIMKSKRFPFYVYLTCKVYFTSSKTRVSINFYIPYPVIWEQYRIFARSSTTNTLSDWWWWFTAFYYWRRTENIFYKSFFQGDSFLPLCYISEILLHINTCVMEIVLNFHKVYYSTGKYVFVLLDTQSRAYLQKESYGTSNIS